jgi:hypothetical protein
LAHLLIALKLLERGSSQPVAVLMLAAPAGATSTAAGVVPAALPPAEPSAAAPSPAAPSIVAPPLAEVFSALPFEQVEGEEHADPTDLDLDAEVASERIGSRRTACTRRRRRSSDASESDDDLDDLLPRNLAEDKSDDDADDDDDDADADGENRRRHDDESPRMEEAERALRGEAVDAQAQAASPKLILDASFRAIELYFDAERTDSLELPSTLSSEERKALHTYADKFGLYHRSVDLGGRRRLVISRWTPIMALAAAIGSRAVGSLVARDRPSESMDVEAGRAELEAEEDQCEED